MKMLIVAEERGLIEAITIGMAYTWPGVRVLAATDAVTGLRHFIQEAPDVTLLDLHLRDNEGWALLRQIRAVSHAPVIVLAARGAELEEVKRQGLESDEYLVTPFSPGDLFTRIGAVLRSVAQTHPAASTGTPVTGPVPAGPTGIANRSSAAGQARTPAGRHAATAPAHRRPRPFPHLTPRHG
jgi:DNA-binding response OmpR family regulator